VLSVKIYIEGHRNDLESVAADAEILLKIGQQHGMDFYVAISRAYLSWVRGRLCDARSGADELRSTLNAYAGQGNRLGVPYFLGCLAELEAAAGDNERALALIDEGLAMADEGGQQVWDAFLHRLRGDILLKRDPANTASAEEAYQAAIAIAKRQGARSYELLASLSLANLNQSTARPVDAHAILAPALEGFSPTSEMPEIAEALALLVTLAKTEEVKAAIAQRERRLRLQTAYSHALMWGKGFAADETKAAFDRAAQLAANSANFLERFAAARGQWIYAHVRGEHGSASELASAFLRQAEEAGSVTEAVVARRDLALTSYFLGDFVEARTHCERALAACGPQQEKEAKERYGNHTGPSATACLALTSWQLGEVERARELIEAANRRATELGHFPSMAVALQFKSFLEILRGDAAAALRAAEALEALAQEHGMAFLRARAKLFSGWARGRMHDPAAGAAEVRQALTALTEHGRKQDDTPFHHALLAELEAETLGPERALAHIDEALALCDQSRFCVSHLHRLRGNLLVKRDPANPASAEDAYRTAIATAKEQGARSYELLASLSLAKLYQSTARPAEARAVLAPALEGFSPTPEMPEIAEAQALLESLTHGGERAIASKDQATRADRGWPRQ
jgi:predicted ATPase